MSKALILKDLHDHVMVLTLNRSEALNAFSSDLISELHQGLREAVEDPHVRVIVITGNDKTFAAGADIRELKSPGFGQAYVEKFIPLWDYIRQIPKPIIAAVSGYALGGGCELAMMCDIILADSTAQFGQPEILIGTIPGFGGTQRLPRLIGRTRALEMCLTGRMITAKEAEAWGLVTRIVSPDQLQQEAMALAQKIAGFSQEVAQLTKQAILATENLTLEEGLRLEQRLFESTFTLKDRQEGMTAFLEKRKPEFNKS